MPIKLLFDGYFDRYFHEEQDHESCLWLLLHIPKTAGSSLGSELAGRLKPKMNIEVDYKRLTEFQVEGDPFRILMRERVLDFISSAKANRYRLAMGHLNLSEAAIISSQFEHVRFITLLRHPVDRFISDYRYQRTPAHPTFREFIARFPTIQDYVAAQDFNNIIARTFSDELLDAQAIIRDIEKTFAFVGLQEYYDLGFAVMMRLLGTKGSPIYYERKTSDFEVTKPEITDAIRQLIARENSFDMEIYTHFKQRYAKIRKPLWGYLRE